MFARTVLLSAALLQISIAHSTPIVSAWNLQLNIRDNTADEASASIVDNMPSLPFSTTRTAATLGGTASGASYDFALNGDAGTLKFDFDHSRSGAVDSQNVAAGEVFFQVSTESWFDISGSFNLNGSGRILSNVVLRDLTISGGAPGFIYQSLQYSLNTINEQFVIGETGGDQDNARVGSLPGMLILGHEYLLDYYFDIITPSVGDAGATAHGAFEFSFASTSIPAPSILALPAIGLAGLSVVRRPCCWRGGILGTLER